VADMMEVHNLTYAHNWKKVIHFPDFSIAKGEQFLLLGDSGSGKTTLLHLLGGLLKSQIGMIRIADTDITKLSASALDKFRANNFGFIFQKNHLIGALNVRDNLLMAPFLAGTKQDKLRVKEVLTKLGLIDKELAKINELSQGQAQRVAIARAILNTPSVILADEPTSALDDKSCEQVIRLLLEVSENKSTLIIASHDQRLKSHIQKYIQL
jgi:ABC-type lipoprotein export system ATPase subunit